MMSEVEKTSDRAAIVRAGLHVCGIGKSRCRSGPLLDDHVEAGFLQEGDARRNQRDPGFPRPGLSRNSHSHGTQSSRNASGPHGQKLFFTHSTMASATLGETEWSFNEAYSDTSPVVAGTSR